MYTENRIPTHSNIWPSSVIFVSYDQSVRLLSTDLLLRLPSASAFNSSLQLQPSASAFCSILQLQPSAPAFISSLQSSARHEKSSKLFADEFVYSRQKDYVQFSLSFCHSLDNMHMFSDLYSCKSFYIKLCFPNNIVLVKVLLLLLCFSLILQ